jgi:peptidoglycan-associated lipoprotein
MRSSNVTSLDEKKMLVLRKNAVWGARQHEIIRNGRYRMLRRVVNHTVMTLVGFLLIFSAYGCAGKKTVSGEQPSPTPSATEPSVIEEERVAPEDGIGEEQLAELERQKTPGEEGRQENALQPIFFEYDKYDLTPEAIKILNKSEEYLSKNSAIAMRIEGNCDERGTPEYNLALGERRAAVARQYLINLGISADRIAATSFGEEKPLDPGHDEAAWAKNRRDDFKVITK